MSLSASPPDDAPVSAAVLDAAVDWQLRLADQDTDAACHAMHARWLAANPEHARAWRQLCAIDASLAAARDIGTPDSQVRRTLERPARSLTRRAAPHLVWAVMLCAALWRIDPHQPLAGWFADQRTAVGERRSVALPDGSLLHLNTASAVDVAFDEQRRKLILHGGEIQIETQQAITPGHPADPRPFVVVTPHGSLQALGTRFSVRLDDHASQLIVTESAVLARPRPCALPPANDACPAQRRVEQGQRIALNAAGLGPVEAAPPDSDAWTHGMLLVEDRPLGEVIDALARYRPGHLALAPSLAGLRVTGAFPLDDTDRALASLASVLPLQVEYRTRWWVTVVPSGPAGAQDTPRTP